MGYRSEVYIKIDKKRTIEFLFLLQSHNVTWINHKEDLADEEYSYFYGEDLKWYNSYPDVGAVNSFIENSDNCALIAVGEDEATEVYGDTCTTGLNAYTVVEGFY